MTDSHLTRRAVLGGAAGLGVVGSTSAFAALTMPKAPVAINIVDVAGNLALTKPAFEAYRVANPKLVSSISYSQAPAPELPGKLKAEEDAKHLDIDLVLTGTDALAAGIQQGLYVDLLGTYAADLPKLDAIYNQGGAKMQTLAKGQGVCVAYCPSGPFLEYMPDAVKTPPTTPAELLAYAKANPKRFIYGNPANSGPGRTFLMGLPYLLGDTDPRDPVKGWDKTWAYLAELGKYIEYYPAGTGPTMKELGEGTRDMIVTTTGWDLNPRALGVVPKRAQISVFKNFHWVIDGHYMCVPKGIAADKMAVLLDLMSYMLTKPAQAVIYDLGYFYPGPAVKDVPISMAPAASQKAVADYGRPEYDKMIAQYPLELPLDAQPMVTAFAMWDKRIGAQKGK